MDPIVLPLRFVAPFRCLLEYPFEPGEVRRVMDLPLRLVGYHVCCPGCATKQVILADDVTFREEGQTSEVDERATSKRPYTHPQRVFTDRGVPCLRCRRGIRFSGDTILIE